MFMIRNRSAGVTLIETIVFITVISIALLALVSVYGNAVSGSVDPLLQTRALELAHAQLDEVLARKFDENTPTGGVPACDSSVGPACLGITADADFDDVGDYQGLSYPADGGFTVSVDVVAAGTEIGLLNDALARRVTVTVAMPGGDNIQISAYKTNF